MDPIQVWAHPASGNWSMGHWMYLAVPLAIYAGCVLALLGGGKTEWEGKPVKFFFGQISDTLQRITGFPGWAMAGALSALLFLLVAVMGFYWDVAWHLDFGRDEELFTPSHVMILVGLGGLIFAAGVAIAFATVEKVGNGFKLLGLRVPWSALTLGAMGIGGVAAFPIDNLWHRYYGIDVTLWSPSHLQLVAGGALGALGAWLMLSEAMPRARPTRLGRFIYIVATGAALVGMTTFEGEFDFGVPQFQIIYLPILIAAAGTFTLVLSRVALGPWGALKTVAAYLVLRLSIAFVVGGMLDHTNPRFPLYIPAALAIEAAAWLATKSWSRLRFGLLAGALAGTVGLAAELLWVKVSGWGTSAPGVLPEVLWLGPAAALCAGLLGAGLARAFDEDGPRVPAGVLLAAAAGLIVTLAIPLPRNVGDVDAVIRLEPAGDRARVHVRLDPPNAAEGAEVFVITAWQGGGTLGASFERVGPGRYVASKPVPVSGRWKSMITLERGSEVMAAPIYLPADPNIGASEIAALPVRRVAFARNTEVLMREAHGGPLWAAYLAWAGLATLVVLWAALMAKTAVSIRRVQSGGEPEGIRAAPGEGAYPTAFPAPSSG